MMLALCFAWFTLLAGAFLIWLYTPKGKKMVTGTLNVFLEY